MALIRFALAEVDARLVHLAPEQPPERRRGFDVFNESTVLRRNNRLEASNTDWVQEVVSPRVFRLSARLRFR